MTISLSLSLFFFSFAGAGMLLGHTSLIKSLTVNEAEKVFASGSKDRTVKLWSLNVHQGIENWETEPYSECLTTYSGHRRNAINDIHFLSSHNGQTDMIASSDGQVHVRSFWIFVWYMIWWEILTLFIYFILQLWSPETGKTIHQFSIGRSSIVSLKPFLQSRNLVGATAEGYLT